MVDDRDAVIDQIISTADRIRGCTVISRVADGIMGALFNAPPKVPKGCEREATLRGRDALPFTTLIYRVV